MANDFLGAPKKLKDTSIDLDNSNTNGAPPKDISLGDLTGTTGGIPPPPTTDAPSPPPIALLFELRHCDFTICSSRRLCR